MVEIVLGWLVCILFSTRLGSVRGRTGDGFAAGFLLGPVGVIYAGFMPYGTVKCNHCRMWCFKDADDEACSSQVSASGWWSCFVVAAIQMCGGPESDVHPVAEAVLEAVLGATHIEVGPCRLARRAGTGLVSLLPGHGRGRLAALVDGDAAGVENALDAFVGGLFTPNSWTALAPEYVVTAPAFAWHG